jgi:hypothetical protein
LLSVMTRFPDIDTFAGRHQIGRPTRPNVSAAADHIPIHIAHE